MAETTTTHDVIDEFTEEHRQVRDLLLDIADAVQENDNERAREALRELDALSGPHFRYEEEAMYPALVEYFGENKVIDLIEEHDEGIERARWLAEQLEGDDIDEAVQENIVDEISPLFVHVSDCEGLTIYLEEFDDETLDEIAETREQALEEGVGLLEYDDEIRKEPEEFVDAFAD